MLTAPARRVASPLTRAVPIDVAVPAEVWWLTVSDVDPATLDERALDEVERGRAARRRRAEDRLGFVCAHLLVRQLLGRRLGVAAGELVVVRAPCPRCGRRHGRPQLAGHAGLHFSLSRSGDAVLIALATAPVGIDVEAVPSPAVVEAVAPRLHPAERAEIDASRGVNRCRAFARGWTRKEAYLKGRGVGLAIDLAAEHPGHRAAAGWTVTDLPVGPDHLGALAWARAPGRDGAIPGSGLYSSASRL